jgi:hypothetical protein
MVSCAAKPTAEAKADPFWAVNLMVYPQVATNPYHLPQEADCHIEYEDIKSEFCEPTFDVKCEKERYPQQTIDLKQVCKEIVDVSCGLHSHPNSDQGIYSPASPGQEGSEHSHGAEGNVVIDDATEAVQTGLPYIGGYISYDLQPQARHHCHNVKRDYCYTVPVVRDVNSKVNSCHVEQGSKCSERVNRVAKMICKHDPNNFVPAEVAPVVAPVAPTVPVATAPTQFKYVPTQVFYGRK